MLWRKLKELVQNIINYRKCMHMTYIKISNEEYLTVKDAYLNLCVARNAISKK